MVEWPERTIPEKSTPAAVSNALNSRISPSLPQKPACATLTPRPTRFMATLAAPPGRAGGAHRTEHRNRRLGRNAVDIPPDGAIQHHVANHQDAKCGKSAFDQGEKAGLFFHQHPFIIANKEPLLRLAYTTRNPGQFYPAATVYGDQVSTIQCSSGPRLMRILRPHTKWGRMTVWLGSLSLLLWMADALRSKAGRMGDHLPPSSSAFFALVLGLPLGLPPAALAAAQSVDRHLPLHRRHADPAAVAHVRPGQHIYLPANSPPTSPSLTCIRNCCTCKRPMMRWPHSCFH